MKRGLIAAAMALALRVSAEPLYLEGPKEATPEQMKAAVVGMQGRCDAFGYEGVVVSLQMVDAAGNEVVEAVEGTRQRMKIDCAGGLKEAMAQRIQKWGTIRAQQAEFRWVHELTAANIEQFGDETGAAGGPAPKGTEWFRRRNADLSLAPLERRIALLSAPVLGRSSLQTFKFRNGRAWIVLSQEGSEKARRPDSNRIALVLDGRAVDIPMSVESSGAAAWIVLPMPHYHEIKALVRNEIPIELLPAGKQETK